MSGQDDVLVQSRAHIEKGSRSFAKAARLFPADVRASAYMLYAWCRHCDDEIDGQAFGGAISPSANSPSARTPEERLATLRARTLAALAGTAEDPVFVGLHRVAQRHRLPDHLPLDLIEGMAMDVRGRVYVELDDTLSYAYHVAGVVGLMMAVIMGVRERGVLARASDLGIAFQLTNIARDVMADAAAGRVYLPAVWLHAEGVASDRVADPASRAGVVRVTERLLAVADDYYRSAAIGIDHLPFRCAWAVASARRIYSGIGREVRLRGAGAWDSRARVGRGASLAALGLAGLDAARAGLGRDRAVTADRTGLWTPSSIARL